MKHSGQPIVGKTRSSAPHDESFPVHGLDQLLFQARSRLTRFQPHEVLIAIQQGAIVVDIRPEFQRRRDGEIPSAVIVERNHLEWRLHPASSGRIEEALDFNRHWIVICDEGYASSLAAATLQGIGLRRATDVVGGFQAWRAAGLPVARPGWPSSPRFPPPPPGDAPQRTIDQPVGA